MALTQAQRQFYQDNGYVVVENVIPKDKLLELRRRISEIVDNVTAERGLPVRAELTWEPSSGPTAIATATATKKAPLRKLSESLRRRSIVLVISDLYEEPDAIIEALTHVRGRGSDVIVFHLLDRYELQFPFLDSSSFIDIETGERMPVIPEYLRKQYRELIAQHSATLTSRLRDNRMDYALFDTSRPLDQALFTYLLARERFNRVR